MRHSRGKIWRGERTKRIQVCKPCVATQAAVVAHFARRCRHCAHPAVAKIGRPTLSLKFESMQILHIPQLELVSPSPCQFKISARCLI